MGSVLTRPVVLLVVTIASLVVTGYFFNQSQNYQKELAQIKKNPQVLAQAETKDLVSKVGVLVALPTNEQPAIATVTDVSKIKDQPFFAKAQNGDKVLIYPGAKKAYLYSVSLNKILEVSVLNVTGSQNQGEVAGAKTEASPTPTPKK